MVWPIKPAPTMAIFMRLSPDDGLVLWTASSHDPQCRDAQNQFQDEE
jgi:hypothetical protein